MWIDPADAHEQHSCWILEGNGFEIEVDSTVSSNEGVSAANIHPVTSPNFDQVDVVATNGPADGRYDWGQPFTGGSNQMVATGDGTGTTVNYRHRTDGHYVYGGSNGDGTYDGIAFQLNIDGVETPQTLWAEAELYNDDGDLIVDFNPVYTADLGTAVNPNPDEVLEFVTVADHVSSPNGTDQAIIIDPDTGARLNETWTWAEAEALGDQQYCI